ncbi:MAG: hypothetical protein J6P73_04930 [Bacteroidales bacterium]|nr:hypothetical protein [Bacteroidales bacterium]
MNTFRANGKLLLTGEYLVLKGALALALPTRFGQTMTVETVCTPSLQWDAYKPDAKWFSATLNPDTLAVMETDDPAKAEKLSQILQAVKTLNHNAFEQGLRFETRLDFDPEWGLGSSSTLIANLATWADVNPYALLKMTFGGSGYDIACANANGPVFYNLIGDEPQVSPSAFKPPFAEHLFFVYQGKKQQSAKEVKSFNQRMQEYDYFDDVDAVSEISEALPNITTLNDFRRFIVVHEDILAHCLDRDPIKTQYPDFEGSLKSLGAWGGDFILAATPWTYVQVANYFKNKGLDTVFNYHDIIP